MLRVGLTGGIGSGKSAVAELLAGRGAVIIDADAIARELVAVGGDVLQLLIAEFGVGILKADASLDRAELAGRVFNSAPDLARLNAIMHPRIAARTAELQAAAAPGAVVVYDMPLLVENRLTEDWDAIVVVDTPDDVRLARLMAARGLGETDVRDRMAVQATRAERLAMADIVIDNSGDLAALRLAVDRVWADLLARQIPGP
jgi:dephospho-CoA kinase